MYKNLRQELIELTEAYKLDYDLVVSDIKNEATKGESHCTFEFKKLSDKVIEKLRKENIKVNKIEFEGRLFWDIIW